MDAAVVAAPEPTGAGGVSSSVRISLVEQAASRPADMRILASRNTLSRPFC